MHDHDWVYDPRVGSATRESGLRPESLNSGVAAWFGGNIPGNALLKTRIFSKDQNHDLGAAPAGSESPRPDLCVGGRGRRKTDFL